MILDAEALAVAGDESPRHSRRPASRASRLKPGGIATCSLSVALLLVATGCLKRGVTPIRTHFNQGVYHYAHGDYEIAISEYRLALEEDAGDHRAHFNLAEALESRATRLAREGRAEEAEGLRREAEEHYRALLAAHPGHLRASVNLAARELSLGDEAGAEARLRGAIERHPRSALPRIALAAHRFRKDDPAAIRDAIALLEAAVDRDRTNPDANVLLGHAYAALDRHGVAPDGRPDTTSDPDLVAHDLVAHDLVARAREAYERTLEHVPSDVGALMGLARLERRAGQHDRAESLARRALYILPDLLEAHLMLADLLEAQGELEQATAHLWRSRQLEDNARPHLTREDYRRRLLDLYRRLAEQEGTAPPPP